MIDFTVMLEFDLIQHYFHRFEPNDQSVVLGIGDDAAICQVGHAKQLVVAVDTSVAGVHFPIDTQAEDIAYKALAVNLSDFAAMGAVPRWMTLALTLPSVDEVWVQRFSQGLFALAQQHQVRLIGGDTTQGNVSVSIQLLGEISPDTALRRDAAQVGDDIYVSGTLGDAGLGLASLRQDVGLDAEQLVFVQQRLNRPTARLALGQQLLGIADAAIDVSDGLLADLGHIVSASNVGARLNLADLPLSAALQCLPVQQAWQLALSAGDDYELCFCAAVQHRDLLDTMPLVQRIGQIEAKTGIRCLQADGAEWDCPLQGYEHFS